MRSAAKVAFLLVVVASPAARAFVPPNRQADGARGEMAHVPTTTFRFLAEARWGGPTPGSTPTLGADPSGIVTKVLAFSIDRTEVTAGAYAQCVAAGGCAPLDQGDNVAPAHSKLCNYGRSGYERHPINCVTRDEAARYCAFVGKRLPTEIEWELAARGVGGRPFPWGEALPTPRHLNACDASLELEGPKFNETFSSMWGDGDDGWAFTAPVGSFPEGASPYGLLDVAGNVEEWVADAWWDPPDGLPPPGSLSSSMPSTHTGDFVVRGGAWDLNTYDMFSVTRRLRQEANTRAAWLGFRCARDG